jgi:hypothetical protein
MAQWFRRRSLKCEKFTEDRRQVMAIVPMVLWSRCPIQCTRVGRKNRDSNVGKPWTEIYFFLALFIHTWHRYMWGGSPPMNVDGAMYCRCALFHFFKRSVRSLGRSATTLANYQSLTPFHVFFYKKGYGAAPFYFSLDKTLGQLEPNLAGMFLGWSSTNFRHVQFGFNHICSFWEEGICTFSLRVQC